MEIVSFPLVVNGITIPDAGKRPASDPPLKYGLSNMQKTICLAHVPDPANIVVADGTTVQTAIGATAVLDLTSANANPVRWIHGQDNKYKFRLSATLQGTFAGDLATLLSTYNVIVFNKDIASTPYGGFLILTIGAAGSGADLILTSANLRNGKFLATVVKDSKEF
ncbi:hypothetical protein pEaSNUABM35_00084 [Erwinia phage pEa_SNUABM_35]|uniref:Uncharacterized protein n=1 Tax=Erwinia phage pEa_SNUABM_35 TaxID=2869557 RepID=A0AAE7XQZ9_9CAUD|nr:hypothetical protein MPK65_gp084 [Erwinia phage pEa_SNUABM_35]QZE60001.1 hypothetical protein pEaSNUABM35_00084 [Erwinia phage pEa_SNUABM_35]QZE60337.1 hypothetical protein pEaSNUABM36_00084 [Erwinia phage pEa_SNUABM_36]